MSEGLGKMRQYKRANLTVTPPPYQRDDAVLPLKTGLLGLVAVDVM